MDLVAWQEPVVDRVDAAMAWREGVEEMRMALALKSNRVNERYRWYLASINGSTTRVLGGPDSSMECPSIRCMFYLDVRFRPVTHWLEPSNTRCNMWRVTPLGDMVDSTTDPSMRRAGLACWPVPYCQSGHATN